MKRLFVALAALALAVPALAQERRPFGVGISIAPLEGADVPPRLPTVEVYLPIHLAQALRIEPSIGVRTVNRPPGELNERDITLGVGVFAVARIAPPVDMYAGGRLKLDFAHVSNGASDSGTDVIVAAAVGGEDYLSPRFSIGLEAQLGYYSLSSVTRAGTANSDADGFFTTGLAFLRVYL